MVAEAVAQERSAAEAAAAAQSAVPTHLILDVMSHRVLALPTIRPSWPTLTSAGEEVELLPQATTYSTRQLHTDK